MKLVEFQPLVEGCLYPTAVFWLGWEHWRHDVTEGEMTAAGINRPLPWCTSVFRLDSISYVTGKAVLRLGMRVTDYVRRGQHHYRLQFLARYDVRSS